MRRNLLGIFGAMVVAFLIYLGWTTLQTSHAPSGGKGEASLRVEEFKKMPERNRPAISKEPLSEYEQRELADLFSKESKKPYLEMEVSLLQGESVYTNVYESKPGHFAFSHVTPEIFRNDQGKDMVRVKFESREIDFEGKNKDRILNSVLKSIDIHIGKDKHILMTTDEGFHILSIQIGKGSSEFGIEMKIQSEFVPMKPKR